MRVAIPGLTAFWPQAEVAADIATSLEAFLAPQRSPIRTIFREAFEQAGLPYFHPHSIRKTLARFGEQVCKSPEEFKAWSQNLGHEQVLTTFMSYGAVPTERQGDIIRGLGTPQLDTSSVADDLLEALFKRLREERPPTAP